MARKPASSQDFETTLAQLENIVTHLENGDLPLEEALKEFEQGVQLAKLRTRTFTTSRTTHSDLIAKTEDAPLNDYKGNDYEGNA